MPAGLLGEQGVRGGCAGACGRQRIHLAARQLLRASLASAAPRSDISVRSFGPIRRRFYHNARYLSCAGSLQSSGSPASSSVRHAIDTAWRPSAMGAGFHGGHGRSRLLMAGLSVFFRFVSLQWRGRSVCPHCHMQFAAKWSRKVMYDFPYFAHIRVNMQLQLQDDAAAHPWPPERRRPALAA